MAIHTELVKTGLSHARRCCSGTILRWMVLAGLALAVMPSSLGQRTQLKPGWNLFSPAQDVEIGKQAAAEAEKELQLLNDRKVDAYLNQLGKRLAEKAPGEKYPYQFKAVNDLSLNAFALPGGPLYVNRGTIESADNEAQLAGVIGHEIGHAALRHGTNQASKAMMAQMPLAVLGGVLGGGNSIWGTLTQIGAGFGANSLLLKFSRDAERQSDIVGTQLLFDNGMDPRGMAQFFEKIEAETKGGRPPQWLSSHPNPENRIGLVNKEIAALGGNPQSMQSDSPDFQNIKRYVKSLSPPPPPKKAAPAPAGDKNQGQVRKPQPPSAYYQRLQNDLLEMRYPDNWKPYGEGSAVTIAPEGGIVQVSRDSSPVLAYGMIVAVFEPHSSQQRSVSLEDATGQLLDDLKRSNPAMQVARRAQRVQVHGRRALLTLVLNESPGGGQEYDWLVTVLQGNSLVYWVGVAPEADFSTYERTFQAMIDSVRLAR